MPPELAGPHGLDPVLMTPDERLAELGRLLGGALVRLQATMSSSSLSADTGDSCLDFPPHQRRHAGTLTSGKA